ncbi:MAG: DUF2065 domain-containing protein [Pseudomonadota bacterium]
MQAFVMAFGLAVVFEGLVFALAPSRLDDVVRFLETLPVETRRILGLLAITMGVAIVWIGTGL